LCRSTDQDQFYFYIFINNFKSYHKYLKIN
jgi:hypothetical protein